MSDSTATRQQPQRVRIPNAVRSATTVAKLIDANIDTLYDVGYHQTTTSLVAERAGVSRGAMLHHFPTKADLMIATAREISRLRGEFYREQLSKYDNPRDVFLALIDVLWKAMVSPSGIARIELLLSTRSDPEIAGRLEELTEYLEKQHKESVWAIAQSMGLNEEKHRHKVEVFVHLYSAALRGLAIDVLRDAAKDVSNEAVELLKIFQTCFVEHLISTID